MSRTFRLESLGKEFYVQDLIDRFNVPEALRDLQARGLEPLFMPQLVEAMIEAPLDSDLWRYWHTTPSIRVNGKTKRGARVVVFSHLPNYLSIPDNVERVLESSKERRQIVARGYATFPEEEFEKLLDSEGLSDSQGNRLVSVLDYNSIKNVKSVREESRKKQEVSLIEALEDPQTIPFLGTVENAGRYLRKLIENSKEKKMRIRHSYLWDDQPLATLLTTSMEQIVTDIYSGPYTIDNIGTFVANLTLNS